MDTSESGPEGGAPRFGTLAGGPPTVWLSAQQLIKNQNTSSFGFSRLTK